MGKADRIAKQFSGLALAELEDLQFAIEERIERLRKAGASSIEEPQERKVTVREEYRKCGKPTCHCHTEGILHGPYLYERWKEDGQVKSRYIGKADRKHKATRKAGKA